MQLDSQSDVVITDGGGTSFGEFDDNVGDQRDKVTVVADPLEAEAARGEDKHDKEKCDCFYVSQGFSFYA